MSVGIRPANRLATTATDLEVLLRTQAGKRINTIDVHCATSTYTLSATPPECQGGVDLVLDPDQGVQHHRPSLVEVEGVCLHLWLRCRLIWRPAVDVECLDLRFWRRGRFGDGGGFRRRYWMLRGSHSLGQVRDWIDRSISARYG